MFVMKEHECPHFGLCGGCSLRDMNYEMQILQKEKAVKELFSGKIPEELFLPAIPSPRVDGYRNKMEFTFGNERKDGPLTLGLHQKKSFHNIIPVQSCRICDEDFRAIRSFTESFFREREIPFYHRKSHIGVLRHLLIRKAAKTGEILCDLVTTSVGTDEKLLSDWKEGLLTLPLTGKFAGILHTRNDRVADAVTDEGTVVLYGNDHFTEELLGLRFHITPFSFFQTNSLGAEKLYETARSFLSDVEGRKGTVFDLYSGTGTIAQLLSPAAEKVIGVELVEEAVEAAKENAAANGITNCSFLAGDVLKVLDQVAEKPDCIVLDPPRSGVHPKALKKILRYEVPFILYISCKAKSLAEGFPTFEYHGYRPVKAQCIDLFPFTENVETVVLFTRL